MRGRPHRIQQHHRTPQRGEGAVARARLVSLGYTPLRCIQNGQGLGEWTVYTVVRDGVGSYHRLRVMADGTWETGPVPRRDVVRLRASYARAVRAIEGAR